MNTIIVGAGEVGMALKGVLEPYYTVSMFDKFKFDFGNLLKKYEIMHVCFPYSKDFEKEVLKYKDEFKPTHVVIHSTVPPGTSRRLDAIHSPVTGIHPHLETSLIAFEKFLGGEAASEVADYFRKAGMRVRLFDKQETTELMKILDTTAYGLFIEWTKEVKRLCKEYDVPFEAWTLATQNYNEGYQKLGYPEYTRPNLVPIMKKIGGHCVLPNYNLLDSKFTDFLKKLHE